ncbi:MAG: hypothetical protein ACRC9V_04080, partial [Aeromonas sp.]
MPVKSSRWCKGHLIIITISDTWYRLSPPDARLSVVHRDGMFHLGNIDVSASCPTIEGRKGNGTSLMARAE